MFNFNKIKKQTAIFFGLSVVAASLSSCHDNPVFDYEGDCDPHYFLQFVFDRNMHYNDQNGIGADAFPAQVNSVDVYFFNPETGEYVAHYADKGEALRQQGYRLPVDVNPGEYDIIAWCGLADNDGHFSIPETINHNSELKCRMDRKVDEQGIVYSDTYLNAVFHGRISHDFPDKEGEHIATVYLTKDTNYIQLALQHRSGALDAERFSITIDDANGHMAHDNSLLKDDDIQYRPWSQRGGVVDMGDVTKAEEIDNGTGFLVAELATSRLMADRKPYITVTDQETGEPVFRLALVDYLLMMKSDRYSRMDSQEYLDREDEYSIMVFLENKDNEGWFAAQIVINGWHIVNNGLVGL